MARWLKTEVDIAASAERVWAVLSDFERYPQWNPFTHRVDGPAVAGERVTLHMYFPEKGHQRYRVTLTEVEPASRLGWKGTFHVPGLIDGDHAFWLEPTAAGVRVHHDERFGGLLIPFVWNAFINRHLLRAFRDLNANLKAVCEGRPLPVPLPPPAG